MDVINLMVNVTAIFGSLFIYIGITKTKWGKEHQQYQYAIMLASVLFAALLGGLLRWLIVLR